MKKAGILTIGDEILQGQTLNLNSQYISKQLTIRNINVLIHLTVPDKVSKIKEKINKFIIKDYDYIFITGGLGPTHDDVTKKALLELFDSKLIFLKSRHIYLEKKKKKKIPNSQSEILDISKKIENNIGTALGMEIEFNKSKIIILPGVPNEMNAMLTCYFEENKILVTDSLIFTINTFGIYETQLSDKIESVINKYKNKIYCSFLPNYDGVKIRVKILDNSISEKKIKNEIVSLINKYAYSFDNDSLEEIILNLLIKNNLTLSIAESCTGGFISKSITDIPGSSKVFLGGLVAYNSSIKNIFLDIPNSAIKKYGEVSNKISQLMAKNISKKFKSDISISCTGISGPDGGSKEKPVGTVYITINYLGRLNTEKFIFQLDRKYHRIMTKQAALYMLWKLFTSKLKY